MFESLKNLIIHKAYLTINIAKNKVKCARPKWINNEQYNELIILCEKVYRNGGNY